MTFWWPSWIFSGFHKIRTKHPIFTNFIFLSLSHLVENNDTKYYLFFIQIKKVIFWVIFASFGPPCHKKCRRSHNFCPISILLVPKCSEMNCATFEPVSALILNMSFFYPLFVPPLILKLKLEWTKLPFFFFFTKKFITLIIMIIMESIYICIALIQLLASSKRFDTHYKCVVMK